MDTVLFGPDLIETEVYDLRADVPQVRADAQSVVDERAQVLVADRVPHPIAGKDQELVGYRALYRAHLWLWGHHLLTGGPVLGPLVAEVPESSRHCQGAVDSLDGHGSACALDTLFLQRVVRFVVLGGEANLPGSAQHGPGVAAVGEIDVVG